MADLGEVWKTLRSELLADATLVGLLGAADAIYLEWPEGNVPFPNLTLETGSRNPQVSVSGIGSYRPTPQLSIYAIDYYTLDSIFSRLESAWTIPKERSTEIVSDNYRVTLLEFGDGVYVGPLRRTNTDELIHQLAVPLKMRVLLSG